MTRVTLAEARDRLPELLDAATSGESVLIAADDGHEFRIVPAPGNASPNGVPNAGSCRGLIEVNDDEERDGTSPQNIPRMGEFFETDENAAPYMLPLPNKGVSAEVKTKRRRPLLPDLTDFQE